MSLSEKHSIPLGNLITWMGFVALPSSIYFGIGKMQESRTRTERLTSSILKGLLLLSVLWAPICFLLSGNISFTFSQKAAFQGGQSAMRIFWYFNYFLAAAPLLLLLSYGLISLFRKSFASS